MKSLTVSALLLIFTLQSSAQLHGAGGGKVQSKEALGRSWKGPSTSVLGKLFTQKKTTPRTTEGSSRSTRTPARSSPVRSPSAVPTAAGYTFRPAADSGVAEVLSSAFTSNATEKSTLLFLFRELKKSYESEVAKENKSNDLAAAMTFFVASNIVTYHAAEMPSDSASQKLYDKLRDAMADSPDIARLTNTEKQQAHDWLVYMGGFVLAGYVNAKNTNDRKSLGEFKLLANMSMKLILGLDAGTFSPDLKMSTNKFEVDDNFAKNLQPLTYGSVLPNSGVSPISYKRHLQLSDSHLASVRAETRPLRSVHPN